MTMIFFNKTSLILIYLYNKLQVITVAKRMAGQIGITHPFEEKKEEWTQYVKRLEHLFTENGHTNAGKQKSILLTAIGPTAYKCLSSLISPDKSGDKT